MSFSTSLVSNNKYTFDEIIKIGNILAASGYFQDSRDAAQCATKILAGAELGIGPIAAMTGIHIINGKPTFSANLIAMLIKRRGSPYNYRIKEHSNTACEIEFFENGESVGASRFTIEDAAKAEATTGKNAHTWRKFPRNMLFARALSNGARWYCPDIFACAPYTPEELDAVVNEEGEIIEIAPASVHKLNSELEVIGLDRDQTLVDEVEGLRELLVEAGDTDQTGKLINWQNLDTQDAYCKRLFKKAFALLIDEELIKLIEALQTRLQRLPATEVTTS